MRPHNGNCNVQPELGIPRSSVVGAVKVVTANVNGVRAAARRGGLSWLGESGADLICLQEVRASDEQLLKTLADGGLSHLHVAHAESSAKGRAGVALLSRWPLSDLRVGLGIEEFAASGSQRFTCPPCGPPCQGPPSDHLRSSP